MNLMIFKTLCRIHDIEFNKLECNERFGDWHTMEQPSESFVACIWMGWNRSHRTYYSIQSLSHQSVLHLFIRHSAQSSHDSEFFLVLWIIWLYHGMLSVLSIYLIIVRIFIWMNEMREIVSGKRRPIRQYLRDPGTFIQTDLCVTCLSNLTIPFDTGPHLPDMPPSVVTAAVAAAVAIAIPIIYMRKMPIHRIFSTLKLFEAKLSKLY